jgi:hypothetical protein
MSNARKLAANLPTEGQLGNRNILINGAHQVSQRHGTSSVTVAPSDHFVVDRFNLQDYSDATFSSQQVTDAPEAFQYSSKITVTGTDTSLGTTQYQRFMQPIEGFNVSHLNYGWSFAKTTTLSFHVKSSLTGTFYVFVFNSAANRSFVSAYTINTANTWEKKSISIAGDQGGTWLKDTGVGMYLGWSLGTGTNFKTSTLDAWQGAFDMAGSNQVNLGGTNGATWQITGCQLEVGPQSTPFEHEPMPFTLSKCQRYLIDLTPNSGTTPYIPGTAAAANSNIAVAHVAFPVQMRATPSLVMTAGNYRLYNGGTHTVTAIQINGMSPVGGGINFTANGALTTGQAVGVYSTGTGIRTLCSAEL